MGVGGVGGEGVGTAVGAFGARLPVGPKEDFLSDFGCLSSPPYPAMPETLKRKEFFDLYFMLLFILGRKEKKRTKGGACGKALTMC